MNRAITIDGNTITKTKRSKEEIDQERLIIPEIMDLVPLKVPPDIQRDVKKLTQYLKDLTDSFNKLMKGVQRFNK